ncbi:MAG: hypothetical protein U5L95_00020 [Candidatus Saccharibacteria bacterium]|nr:hypothetical protein [Candidatus Saccharibacteria bacterium]
MATIETQQLNYMEQIDDVLAKYQSRLETGLNSIFNEADQKLIEVGERLVPDKCWRPTESYQSAYEEFIDTTTKNIGRIARTNFGYIKVINQGTVIDEMCCAGSEITATQGGVINNRIKQGADYGEFGTFKQDPDDTTANRIENLSYAIRRDNSDLDLWE